GERNPFRRPLDLDNSAAAGEHEIGIGGRDRVLRIIQVENRGAAVDATGDSGHLVLDGMARDQSGRGYEAYALIERDKASSDRGGTGPAIGLDDVAIDDDLAFAEHVQCGHRAQRTADETLDFLGAAALLARGCLAPGALGGCAREHAVFGRYPAAPRTAQE